MLFSFPSTQIPRAHGAGEDEIIIVYTNSLNGYLDYCRCRENPRGGLVKRATEIKKIRMEAGEIFLFETGDFFSYEPDPLLAGYIVKAYRHIGYDAMVFGDQEFTIGRDEFMKHLGSLPFVADNIRLGSGPAAVPRYKIIEKGRFRIGIIGTVAPEAFKYYPEKIIRDIRVLDQAAEINRDAEELKRKGVDLIVLLSHSGFDRDRELLRNIKGIHVIIGGHSQTLIKEPVVENNSVIVQAGADGSRIGILRIKAADGIIKSIKNSFRHPTEYTPADDEYIRGLIKEYLAKSKKDIENIRLD